LYTEARENKSRKYILPNNECEDMSLLEALDEWAAHLNVASEIAVEKSNSFGFSVSISNTQRKKSDIMNVGIGTSQVLPVLITGLLSEPEEYLFFEQPELHLHPYSQSRLADFFVELVKRGRKIAVETHSEYFVLRMRYQILAGNISERDITVNFFQNKGCTRISQGKLSGYGNLQYPDDFRDETQKLLDDLMSGQQRAVEKLRSILKENKELFISSPQTIKGDHHNHIQSTDFNCYEQLAAKNKRVLNYLRYFGLSKIYFNEFAPDKSRETGTIKITKVDKGTGSDIVTAWLFGCDEFRILVELYFPRGIGDALQAYSDNGELSRMGMEELKTELVL